MGATVRANGHWRSDQQVELEATGIQPTKDAESVLVATLPPAITPPSVRGAKETTGIGLVEVSICSERALVGRLVHLVYADIAATRDEHPVAKHFL